MVGGSGTSQNLPRGLEGEELAEGSEGVAFERRRAREKRRKEGKRGAVKNKEWILKKKEVQSFDSLLSLLADAWIAVIPPERERRCSS